jgi:hypothetical protein
MLNQADVDAILVAIGVHERREHLSVVNVIGLLSKHITDANQWNELTSLLLIQIAVGELIAARVPPKEVFEVIEANSNLTVEVKAGRDQTKLN